MFEIYLLTFLNISGIIISMKFETTIFDSEKSKTQSERTKKINKALLSAVGAALAITTLAGATGCSKVEAKPVDTTIESVTLDKGARLRSEPLVGDSLHGEGNLLDTVDDTMTVEANQDIQVKEDLANGDWYGIPAESLKRVDPDLDIKGDKDGVVWVNTQLASVVQDGDTAAK